MTRMGHSAERNEDATVYVGSLDPQVSEKLLWELFTQVGPVVSVCIQKDRVKNHHQRFGFVEFRSEEDAIYAINVLNMVTLYGHSITVQKASEYKNKNVGIGANLFVGNLDPEVDEKLLYDTFMAFGVVYNPKIMRDPDTGNSRGFGFISYDSFEASDAAIEAMTGQYLCNRQITVSYAYKKDTKGERHGTPAERLLAAANPSSMKNKPHMVFENAPQTRPNAPEDNGIPRPFANGGMQHVQIPGPLPTPQPPPPPPPPQAYHQTQPLSQSQQQHGLAIPPPMQFGPPQGMPPPPPPQFHHYQQGFGSPRPPPPPPPQFHHYQQGFSGPRPPPPPPQALGMNQHGWPPQHMQQGGPPQPPVHHHHHMSMPPPPPQHMQQGGPPQPPVHHHHHMSMPPPPPYQG